MSHASSICEVLWTGRAERRTLFHLSASMLHRSLTVPYRPTLPSSTLSTRPDSPRTTQLIATYLLPPSTSPPSLSPSYLPAPNPSRNTWTTHTHAHVYEPPPAPPFNLRLVPPLSRVVATAIKLDVHVASAGAISGALGAGSLAAVVPRGLAGACGGAEKTVRVSVCARRWRRWRDEE